MSAYSDWEADPWYKERAKALFGTTGFRQVVRYRDRETHEPVCFAWQNHWIKYPKYVSDPTKSEPLTLLPFENYIATNLSSKWDDIDKQLQSSLPDVRVKNWKTGETAETNGRQVFFAGLDSEQPMVSCFTLYYCTGEKLRELIGYVTGRYSLASHIVPLTSPDASAAEAEDMLRSTFAYLFERRAT